MRWGKATDPLPLSPAQIRVLASAVGKELSWGLIEVGREERAWRRYAERIPDRWIRADALDSLERKRGNMVGAALFATAAPRRSKELLRALAIFQAIVDFLDNLNERHPGERNGINLHRALIDAVEPRRPIGDYYARHSSKDDAGYLNAMVQACQQSFGALPSYERVLPLLIPEVTRAQRVLALNHLPDPLRRDEALEDWAVREFPDETEWKWFELSGAVSGILAMLALIVLAAKPDLADHEIAQTYDVYWPPIPLICLMLDSFVDQSEDEASGDHRYVAHYSDLDQAVTRLAELIDKAAYGVLGLPSGRKHAVIMSCMINYYLSKDSARTPEMSANAAHLVGAGGSLTRLLAPVLRIWRVAYSQRTA